MRHYLRSELGASASEYAMILAIIGVGMGLAVLTLGGLVSNAMNRAGNCVATTSGTC